MIAAQCAEDRSTSLPEDVVSGLRREQAFSLLLPETLGGQQLDLPDFIDFVKQVAIADGSCGWCVNQGSVLASLARFLPHTLAKSIWSDPGISVANGPPISSRTQREGDHFMLSGRWTFSSGINHATWLLGVATLAGPGGSQGVWHLFPMQAAKITDNWDVAGLRGTGSYQFEVEDLRVPAELGFEVRVREEDPPLYQVPLNLLFACGFAAVALGVARGAIDFAIDRVRSKIKRFDTNAMSEDMLTQDQIGRAEALWQSTNLYLKYQVSEVWEEVCRLGHCSLDNRIRLRLAATHAIRQSKAASDIVYDLCSTDSIFTGNDIQKRFQDIHVISQHLQGRPEIYSIVGRHYLGLPVNSHLVN